MDGLDIAEDFIRAEIENARAEGFKKGVLAEQEHLEYRNEVVK